MIKLINPIKDYSWGSKTLIQELFNIKDSKRIAEIWVGTHKSGPSINYNTKKPLNANLTFMIKALAADKPLSIQVHPNKSQAEKGFNDNNDNYSDPNEKSELIYALSEFKAFAGFKNINTIKNELTKNKSKLSNILLCDLNKNNNLKNLVNIIFGSNQNDLKEFTKYTSTNSSLNNADNLNYSDIVFTSLLEQHTLKKYEGMYLPAGIVHSYISGLGIEVMNSSDNVVRGGMTPKKIDKTEFLKIMNPDLHCSKFVNGGQNETFIKGFKNWTFYDACSSVEIKASLGLIISDKYSDDEGNEYNAGEGIFSESGIIKLTAKTDNAKGVFVK